MARVIIIDDDKIWLNDTMELINELFDSEIEYFYDFSLAEDRIIKSPNDFDLLITDIYIDKTKGELEVDKRRDDFGLSITKLLNRINNIPIIIVTAEDDEEKIRLILKNYKLSAIYKKFGFKKSDFIISVSEVLPFKNKKGKKEEREDNDSTIWS